MTARRLRAWNAMVLLLLVGAMTCTASSRMTALGADASERMNSVSARFDTAARKACGERAFPTCFVLKTEREPLTDDVSHYTILLQVGPGPFDAIPIHRIVRERTVGEPIQTSGTFFYLHGSANQFMESMLNAARTDGIGLYLANRNVDVWGVDLRWVRIPRGQTDFGFAATWDFDFQVSDILLATRFARHARLVTGQRFDRLNLAGHSLGASLAFAVANADAALRDAERDLAGLIPIDTIYALPPESAATRRLFCDTEARQRANLAAGIFAANSLAGIDAGAFALADPEGISPISPSLSNRQFALNNAAALSFQPALAYHNFSVIRDGSGRPTAARYTDTTDMFKILSRLVPYRALATMADYFAIACGASAQQHTAHLHDITIPALYIGFAGGFGREGLFAPTLLGSVDVTTIFIQLLDDAKARDDFGHLDWLQAGNAEALIWNPIWNWIVAR